MNLITKIPRSLFVTALSVLGFGITDYIIANNYTSHFVGMPSRSYLVVFLFITSLCGIAAAIIIWIGIRKVQNNAWAIAIITGFVMLALFPVFNILIGKVLGYAALLPVTWGLLVANSRIFSDNKKILLKFCALLILGFILWVAGRQAATLIFSM